MLHNHDFHIPISHNVSHIVISAIKEMAMLSSKVDGAVSLAWGLPSFTTPESIRQGVIDHLTKDPDVGKYTLPDGLKELRELVAEKHFQETGIQVDPDNNIMITAGNMQGLNALFHVLVSVGDEVIVTDPGFASHCQQIKLCGGVPVYWPLDESRNWSLNLDSLPELVTDKTRAIVFVSPSNPTGKIFTREELLQVAGFAKERDLMILFDDPYSFLTYENRDKWFNLASVEDYFNNIAYLFSFSKAYAMSGWRLAYMIIPEELKHEILKVHDSTIICTSRISQLAGISALSGDQSHFPDFRKTLSERRNLICERLDRVPHVFEYQKPEGAYYIFPKIITKHSDSLEFAMRLLYDAKVTVTPGGAFGPHGEHHVRMAFCVSEDEINLAFDRIEQYFGK